MVGTRSEWEKILSMTYAPTTTLNNVRSKYSALAKGRKTHDNLDRAMRLAESNIRLKHNYTPTFGHKMKRGWHKGSNVAYQTVGAGLLGGGVAAMYGVRETLNAFPGFHNSFNVSKLRNTRIKTALGGAAAGTVGLGMLAKSQLSTHRKRRLIEKEYDILKNIEDSIKQYELAKTEMSSNNARSLMTRNITAKKQDLRKQVLRIKQMEYTLGF